MGTTVQHVAGYLGVGAGGAVMLTIGLLLGKRLNAQNADIRSLESEARRRRALAPPRAVP